jgi:hypothetical protein
VLDLPPGQRVLVRDDGRYLVKLGSFREAVTGEVSILAARSRRGPLRLTTKSFQASSGNGASVLFGTSAEARKLLSGRSLVTVRLVLTARDVLGNARVAHARVVLVRHAP